MYFRNAENIIYHIWRPYGGYVWGGGVMVFNATFNNISVMLWQSVLLVEKTRVPWENQWPAASYWQTLSHNVVSSTPRPRGVRTHVSISGIWIQTGISYKIQQGGNNLIVYITV